MKDLHICILQDMAQSEMTIGLWKSPAAVLAVTKQAAPLSAPVSFGTLRPWACAAVGLRGEANSLCPLLMQSFPCAQQNAAALNTRPASA